MLTWLLFRVQYEYLWADGVKYKKPVRLSAPEYVDKLFDWIEDQVRHATVATEPCKHGCIGRLLAGCILA